MKKIICVIFFLTAFKASLFAQQVEATTGRVTFLRLNNIGEGYGPPGDKIAAEVIIKISSKPDYAFGFQLRKDDNELTHTAMFEMLHYAFTNNLDVRIEYTRLPNRKNFILFRVILER